MRRPLSILLLVILALGPAGPASAFASGPSSALRSGWTGIVDESRLPACCRRGGKHHCSMGSEGSEDSELSALLATGESAISASGSCPFAPHTMVSTAPSVAALADTAATSAAYPGQLRNGRGNLSPAGIGDRRSQPERGPPSIQIL